MITIGRPTLHRLGASSVASCRVSLPGKTSQDVWIRVAGDVPVEVADPFVAFALLPAMKLGVSISSEAPVSRTLLNIGIPTIQRVHQEWAVDKWCRDFPTFQAVHVAAQAVDDVAAGAKVGVFYSGGVDSSFSLLRFRDEITHLVFIADFEGTFSTSAHQDASGGVERVAASLGKSVIQAATNAKDVFGPYVSWHHYHGSLLGGIALALQDQLGTIHIPPSYAQDRLVPWGSHPDVDPLWSTGGLRVVHDETHATRFARTAMVADDPVLLRDLRVCWRPEQNCGECPKCVRTLLALQLLDRHELGPSFSRGPLTPYEVSRLDARSGSERLHLTDMQTYLERTGRHPTFLRAIDHALKGRYYTRLGSMFRGDLRVRSRANTRKRIYSLLVVTRTLPVARRMRHRFFRRRSA